MKLSLILLISAFSFFPVTNDKEKIAWKENQKLSWADFKGKPSGSPVYAASTNSGISFSFSSSFNNGEVKLDYSIETNFYPNLSWYRKEVVNAYILAHEQTHFDITELYARKLRKKLTETEFSSKGSRMQRQIEEIYNTNEKQRRETQHTFDRETEHSRDHAAEAKWELYVAQQLDQFDAWK